MLCPRLLSAEPQQRIARTHPEPREEAPVIFRRQSVANVHHHDANLIVGPEQSVDDCAGDGEFAFAQLIENVLRVMGQFHQLFKAEEAGGSLDGMHPAEDAVQYFGIGAVLKREQVLFYLLDKFIALGNEIF
jgi:hypothetical protein